MDHIFIPVSPDDLHLGGSHKGAERTKLVWAPGVTKKSWKLGRTWFTLEMKR